MFILKLRIIATLILFGNLATAQVYFSQNEESLTPLTEENSPKLSEEISVYSKMQKALEKQKSGDKINVVDSVVFTFSTDAEGKPQNILDDFGYSKKHRDQLAKSISQLTFKAGLTFRLAFVFSPLQLKSIFYKEIREIPEMVVCNNVNSKNKVFKASCFYYLIENESRSLPKPSKKNMAKVEGILSCNLIIGQKGKVEEISFFPESFNPELNDYAIQNVSDFNFPDGIKHEGQAINYSISFQDYYYDIKLDKTEDYISIAEKYFEQDEYYKAIFNFNKAVFAGFQLSAENLKQKGLACYFVADTSMAKSLWLTTFSNQEIKGNTLHYEINGKEVALSMKPMKPNNSELVKDAAPLDFDMVDIKPIFPGCEKEKTEEAKCECFNFTLLNHVSRTFNFPPEARERGIQGKVLINFIVDKDGRIIFVHVVESVDILLDLEAMRVVCMLPKFEPAYQGGKAVSVEYTVPINLKLQ